MNLDWIKCEDDTWCKLNTVDLDHSHFDGMEGIYIVWHAGENPATVRVGQGVIRDRIASHREDPDIQAFANLVLFVTWASVESPFRDGIEAYLAVQLDPMVGERFPNRRPIPVNLPW